VWIRIGAEGEKNAAEIMADEGERGERLRERERERERGISAGVQKGPQGLLRA
jgi:hypothetical protein